MSIFPKYQADQDMLAKHQLKGVPKIMIPNLPSLPRQAFSYWCVANRGLDDPTLFAGAVKIGYTGVELLPETLWPLALEHGLTIVSANGHASIEDGLNRPGNAGRIMSELRENLAKALEWKIPVLICFSGNSDTTNDAAAQAHCAATLSELAPEFEKAGVTLALELLNSKVDHPGYQCDHTPWGLEVCRRVNSPAVKLLYDIYHMQIMEGDLIRTIREHHAWIGHYHTAGNPGRGPLDQYQEIYYPPVFRAIRDTGYDGFIGHEFIPRRDPLVDLKEASDLCGRAWQ